MRIRCVALVLCLSLGCRGLSRPDEFAETAKESPLPVDHDVVTVAATFVETPASATTPSEDALGLAAACIEKGDSAGAAEQLAKHLQAHPDQIMIRAYLAEVLLKMKRFAEAQHQFERFIADAQEAKGPANKHILHCHTRLMEIAQERDDLYGEHLHRGIGMVLLARQLAAEIDSADVEPGFRERLLCKGVAELNKAKKLRPDEPRPYCYLFEAFIKLDQPRSADRAWQTARNRSALLPLSLSEQKTLLAPR